MKKVLRRLCLISLLPTLLAAQSNNLERTPDGEVAREVQQLKEKMAMQEKLLSLQQQEIDELKARLGGQFGVSSPGPQSSRLVETVMRISDPYTVAPEAPAAAASSSVTTAAMPQDRERGSPLSFRIGGAEFTPGGFLDFTSIFRTTNTGNLGTNFFNIPFNNTVPGNLTETRFTAQNSRVSLKADTKFGKNEVTGYVEADFLGNDATNVFITSNSHTFRQRLYWVDVRRDKWEILGGQSWSWLTPNRVGLSPLPKDIFYSQNEDFNYQVGLTWTRAPQFRVAYHPNDSWAFGVALENPQQFSGQGEVTFPSLFNGQLATQFDSGANPGTPNLHPDIIPKVAYDTDISGKHFHVEAAGLLTSVKTRVLLPGATAFNPGRIATGGGIEAAINLELFKNIRLVSNVFWSDGGGRYIFGMAPGAVVRPNATGTDAAPSLVHSGSGIAGVEAQVTPQTMFYGYYGGMYAQRNFFVDTTSTAATKPLIGFGAPNSPAASQDNRAIQEGTFGWIQTFWQNPQYGKLQFITQYSYLTRSPWFVATDAATGITGPKNAHLSMVWLDLRYVLP